MANFRGLDGVTNAFEAAKIETWAVFDKKSIMQSGEGSELLTEYLTLLESHGSTTVYGLRMYRSEPAENITDKTPYNSAFTFQLLERNGGAFVGGGSGVGNTFGLMQRIAALEKEIKDKDAEKEPSIGSTMLGWIQEPDDVVKLIGAVKMLFTKQSPAETMQAVAALGNVAPVRTTGYVSPEPGAGLSEPLPDLQQLQIRLANAITRLEKCDPEILLHLEQLAALAETNPAMYKMAIGFLK